MAWSHALPEHRQENTPATLLRKLPLLLSLAILIMWTRADVKPAVSRLDEWFREETRPANQAP